MPHFHQCPLNVTMPVSGILSRIMWIFVTAIVLAVVAFVVSGGFRVT
ncbi:hypothetical protein [Phyllobacterium brassicacearum]|nr:hypothetical protein [Phyllobacterium brassicacearum]